MWTYKNTNEKEHKFSWRKKSVKMEKADEKRMLCKFTLIRLLNRPKEDDQQSRNLPTPKQANCAAASEFCALSMKPVMNWWTSLENKQENNILRQFTCKFFRESLRDVKFLCRSFQTRHKKSL